MNMTEYRQADILRSYSIEITARDTEALRKGAHSILPGTQIAVTFLPGESASARLSAIRSVRELGFEPMPHFSARRILSVAEFEDYLFQVTEQAGVKRCFVVAGDLAEAKGPFFDSFEMITSGAFEKAGIQWLGVGGHPEGHPHMTEDHSFDVLDRKCAEITRRGMAPTIVTQFGFDATPVIAWLEKVRSIGIDAPVRLGIPGPADVGTLLRFAARCGVSASKSVMMKYGLSLSNLIGNAGPDKLVMAFAEQLDARHGEVALHFYPFGGVPRTMEWIERFARRHPGVRMFEGDRK